MDATEDLVAACLSHHAADAPSDDGLLSEVQHRLRRRTGRTIGAAVLACAAVATAIIATHSLNELRTAPSIGRPDDVQAPGITQYDGGWTEETRSVGGPTRLGFET